MNQPGRSAWRDSLHEIIFEADTPGGKAFDVWLLILIMASILVVMLESVASIRSDYGTILRIAEWGLTVAFTIEYILRLVCVQRPSHYARSFFGVVDVLSIAPTYLSLFLVGAQSFLVIRALRLLRVFRVLKLGHFLHEATVLRTALHASMRKITVFIGVVLTTVLIVGALMYIIEGADAGFTSIPRSAYWAIVTMTTVGYGDIAPQTPLGQIMASALMVMGYGVIAVPTGIVSVELGQATRTASQTTRACPACGRNGHTHDARYCKYCSSSLN